MASHPPFNEMEDQTDADFFDNLVDDDFGPSVSSVTTSVAASALKSAEESDSDEAKAFSNLSIEDEGNGWSEELVVAAAVAGISDAPAKETLAALLSEPDTIGASNSEGIVSDDALDTGESKTGGGDGSTPKSGVKEVGWASFYADNTMPNGNGNEFGSYSDFFNDLGGDLGGGSEIFSAKVHESNNVQNGVGGGLDSTINYEQYPDATHIGGGSQVVEGVNGQDTSNSQDWEDAYPGWKYDVSTGQWYQVDGYGTTAGVQQGSFDGDVGSGWADDGKTEVNYFQQSTQSAVGTMAETGTTVSVSNWNQISEANNAGYPDHMFFDPQYPGWYYDKNTQEWKSLESYTTSALSTSIHYDQQSQSGYASTGAYPQNSNSIYGQHGQADNYVSEGYNSQGQHSSQGDSYNSHNQQGVVNMWQPESAAKSSHLTNFGGNQQLDNLYSSNISKNHHVDQHSSFNSLGTVSTYENPALSHTEANGFIGSQGLGNFGQQFNQGNLKQNEQMTFSNHYNSSQKQGSMTQHPLQNNQQYSYAPNRSSAGRPPHALVTFGFGGKLIVMKDNSSLGNSSFGNLDTVASSSISVLNLMEVVSGSGNSASTGGGSVCNYLHALSHRSFSGPLLGGNVGSKELNKWIDERIVSCESSDMKLLLSLLKIVSQHYGKIESDGPESALAKLFASAKKNRTQFSEYGGLIHGLQNLPSEGQIQATVSEVENLLVSGRTKEALQCAQDGQLWGPALVLSSQLGDQFYVDTVKLMAQRQLVVGSPLRTLCLLIAGQGADVIPTDTSAVGAPHPSQQPGQFGVNGMLDDWEQNLAVMTANRTKNDDYVMKHLGDCLWRDRSAITAAHICYLVAEEDFKPYSKTSRLCLVGADHLRDPRTYASPEAIQRTELYEYSKVLGNAQFILLPFQPYKIIYAHMLAEIGKVADALKYCQAVSKSLKAARAPEVDVWRHSVSSLEERIKTHLQGGYSANLAPAKLVGKLLNFIDTTAHRVVGGLPPPVPSPLPSPSLTSPQGGEHYQQAMASRVSASQSTMAMSSLVPSASMEPISGWNADGNRMAMHNRSVSEPDFGRTPRQVDPSKEKTSSSAQGKTSGSVVSSRFPRFGFGSQLLQKTVGLVLRPRSDKQAKLGESNKFYYDEKLKRWVEEGVEPPAEQAALPPPPTTVGFQNGMSDYSLKSALKNDGSSSGGSPTFKSSVNTENISSGIPPIPSSSNQFSARGRMGVRARYVDTFNKGGGSLANTFQSPPLPSVKPAVAANAKFFVPAPAPSSHYSMESIAENVQDNTETAANPSTTNVNDNSFQSPSLQKFPSMDNMAARREFTNNSSSSSMQSHSRRTSSWSGSSSQSLSAPPKMMESIPYGGESFGGMMAPPRVPAMQNQPSSMTPMPINGGSFGDLQEVEL